MKLQIIYFASPRYWAQDDMLQTVETLGCLGLPDAACTLVQSESDLAQLAPSKDTVLVAVALSGAVQSCIMAAAARYGAVVLYGVYIEGNVSEKTQADLLRANAAPTFMDCWAMLRRTHAFAATALNKEELQRQLRVMSAHLAIKGQKLLVIGETEPWVISSSRNMDVYRNRFGIEVECVLQQDVLDRYAAMADAEAAPYEQFFRERMSHVEEPSDRDITNAARMTAVLVSLLEEHGADGMAIACFDLLRCGTTACMGVSYINDYLGKFAACEGDVDSACTMMLMSKLTKAKVWMANPALCPDQSILYSHCTAPVQIRPDEACNCILRNHHESGIGVSLQVALPEHRTVTLCRISDNMSSAVVFMGETASGKYLPCCRTQIYVKPDDFTHYMDTALGCHQVMVFDDIRKELELLIKSFGIALL